MSGRGPPPTTAAIRLCERVVTAGAPDWRTARGSRAATFMAFSWWRGVSPTIDHRRSAPAEEFADAVVDLTNHLSLTTGPGALKTEDGGDLVTDKEFEDYELRLEWKISPCGNSGVMFNVIEAGQYEYPWQTGPEMQIIDNTCHPDARFESHRAGCLYDLVSVKYETVKPAGEWNKVRIHIRNGKSQFWLNGRQVVEFEMFNGQWERMIQNSKFKDMPDFGKARKGRICLQDHNDAVVWFRNIKIREIND